MNIRLYLFLPKLRDNTPAKQCQAGSRTIDLTDQYAVHNQGSDLTLLQWSFWLMSLGFIKDKTYVFSLWSQSSVISKFHFNLEPCHYLLDTGNVTYQSFLDGVPRIYGNSPLSEVNGMRLSSRMHCRLSGFYFSLLCFVLFFCWCTWDFFSLLKLDEVPGYWLYNRMLSSRRYVAWWRQQVGKPRKPSLEDSRHWRARYFPRQREISSSQTDVTLKSLMTMVAMLSRFPAAESRALRRGLSSAVVSPRFQSSSGIDRLQHVKEGAPHGNSMSCLRLRSGSLYKYLMGN